MSAAIQNEMDIPFAKTLLEQSRSQLSLEKIPLRWRHPHGGGKGWAKGNLVEVHGSSLMVRPLTSTHGDRLEPQDPKLCKLWVSQMPPEMKALAVAVRETLLKPKPTNGHELNGHSHQQATEIVKVIHDVHDVHEETTIVVREGQSIEGAVADLQAHPPFPFASKFAEYVALRRQLTEAVKRGDGLKHLQSLRSDYDEAVAMAEVAKQDMLDLIDMLKGHGVVIPPEIIKGIIEEPKPIEAKPALPPPPARLNAGTNIKQLPQQVKSKPSTSWATSLARKEKSRILEFMAQQPNLLYKGREIVEPLGIKVATPSGVLGPLVHDGSIVQYGVKGAARYQLRKK